MKLYSIEELNNYPQSLTYNDISLIPGWSQTEHRRDISLETDFLGRKLKYPILSSPMDSVSGELMCRTLNELGCLGIPGRALKEHDGVFTADARSVTNRSPKDVIACFDTANGANSYVHKEYNGTWWHKPKGTIIGNFATCASAFKYFGHENMALRVGIGNGSMCTTSIQTGIGIGQVSAIADFYCGIREHEWNCMQPIIIADGGINTPGDILKALCLGADVVMLGRMLAGTEEAPGKVINGRKEYYGSASMRAKNSSVHIEGENTTVPYKGKVADIIATITEGLQSGISYLGFNSLQELKDNRKDIKFAILTSNSYFERLPKF